MNEQKKMGKSVSDISKKTRECVWKHFFKLDKSGKNTKIHIMNELSGYHHPVKEIKTQNIACFNKNRKI